MFITATKDTETDHKLVADSFSDNFSPQQLCDWLAAVLGKKGLELGEERDLFISKLYSPGWQALALR